MQLPTETDVLCGNRCSNGPTMHLGNRLFRRVIASFVDKFDDCSTKRERSQLIRQIITQMRHQHGSRFLRRDDHEDWVGLEEQAIRDKVSHALRFCARQHKHKEAEKKKREEQQRRTSNGSSTTSDDKDNRNEPVLDKKTAALVAIIYQRQQLILKGMIQQEKETTHKTGENTELR